VGLFKKAKEAAQQTQQAFAQQPQGDGKVHVQDAGGMMDPAMFGGPSTRSVAADDPIWQPINGISLQDYADLARDAGSRRHRRARNDRDCPGAWVESGGYQGGARRLGAADGPVDGRRAAVPQVAGLLSGVQQDAYQVVRVVPHQVVRRRVHGRSSSGRS